MNHKAVMKASAAVLVSVMNVSGGSNMIGQMTQNEGMLAVPVPAGGVVIDGDLSEWDLSGEIWSFADYDMRDQYSVKSAAMWDEENLYLSFRWKDPLPLNSTVNPDFDAGIGWRADAVQCRMKVGEKPLWLTSWFYEGVACVDIAYWLEANDSKKMEGKLYKSEKGGVVLGDGVESCYKLLPTMDGFVHEMKLPWAVLRKGSEGRVGDSMLMGLEFKWGDVSGRGWPMHAFTDNMAKGETSRQFYWTKVAAWGALELVGESVKEKRVYRSEVIKPAGTIPVRVEVPLDAKTFTVVLDDAEGKRVRNLAGGYPVESFKVGEVDERAILEVMWDGLDEVGQRVSAGEYTVRGLTHQGLVPTYEMSFYNPGTPPWGTPDGKGGWGSDHSRPEFVARSGENMILACNFVEGGSGIWAVGPEGKKRWSEVRGVSKMAANDTYVFSIPNDWYTKEETLYRYHAADGSYAPFMEGDGERAMNMPIREILGVESLTPCFPEEDGTVSTHGLATNPRVMSLVAGPRSVLLGLAEGKVVEIDAERGVPVGEYALGYDATRMEKVATVNTDTFGRYFVPMAYDGEAIWYYRGGKLTRYIVKTGSAETIETSVSVEKPVSIALDAKGNVYVADTGADSQVKQFTPKGELVATYGKRGGRPRVGDFDPLGMQAISSVSVDREGCVWVVEFTDYPRRVTVWNSDGTFKRDYVGNTGYSGVGCYLHDQEPGRFFCGPNEFRFDESSRTSEMKYVMINPEPNSPTISIPTGANEIGHVFMSEASGEKREYYFRGGDLFLHDQGTWKSVSSVFMLGEWQRLFSGGWRMIPEKEPYGEFAGMNPFDIVVWNDLNGDGLIQRDECEVLPSDVAFKKGDTVARSRISRLRTGWGQRMDPGDLSFYMTEILPGGKPAVRWRFAPASFAPNGAPRYTLGTRTKIAELPNVESLDMVPVPGEDRIVTFSRLEKQGVMLGLNKAGVIEWMYANPYDNVHGSHSAVMPRPGLLIGPLKVAGVVRDCGDAKGVFMLRGNLGSDFYFTTDGLFVDSMFRDERLPRPALPATEDELRAMPFGMLSMGGEPFNGWIGRQDDGVVRMLCGFAGQASSLVTIQGLETIRRFEGGVLKVDEAMLAQAAEEAARSATEGLAKPYTVTRVTSKPTSWRVIPTMAMEREGLPSKGWCRLAYSDTTLFVRFDVREPSPWKNYGTDRTRMFKTGDCVDVQLSPSANRGRDAVEGDLRIVVSPFGEDSVAMLMRKVWRDAKPDERVHYESPVRAFDMAQVKPIGRVEAVRASDNAGYSVELEVEWAELGIEAPRSGTVLRGDVGVIFSDESGTHNTARVYYSNRETNLVNDLPGEADLYPQKWVEFVLE